MSAKQGVCAFIPVGQEEPTPRVLGMGIFIGEREVLTCAHVIDTVLGAGWQQSQRNVVRLRFPYLPELPSVTGRVDRTRWYPDPPVHGELVDIAVVLLDEPPPPGLEVATLKLHVSGSEVSAYGFRSEVIDGQVETNRSGEHVPARVSGPLPRGRVQFGGVLATDPRIEGGYSGAGVYDKDQDAIVGMVVRSDRDRARRVFQFIDVPSLNAAIGRPPEPKPTLNARKLNVVLCHTQQDASQAHKLQRDLERDGFVAWTPADIAPGENIEAGTDDAFRKADVLIVCLSRAVAQRGEIHRYIARGLEISKEVPHGQMFLIPVKLEPCDIPTSLQTLQAASLYGRDGYEVLRGALHASENRLAQLRAPGARGDNGPPDDEPPAGPSSQAAKILDPKPEISGPAFVELARELAAEERFGMALRFALRALERLPKDSQVLSEAANYAERADDHQTAVVLLERLSVQLLLSGDANGLATLDTRLDAQRQWVEDAKSKPGPRRTRIDAAARIAYRRMVSGPSGDYFAVALLGLLPILTAVAVGVDKTISITVGPETKEYTGFLDSHWPWVCAMLPLVFILMRRAVRFMIPESSRQPVMLKELPPVLRVTGLRPGKAAIPENTPLSTAQLSVHRLFMERLCGPTMFLWVVGIATLIQVADFTGVLLHFIKHALGISTTPKELDWSVMFLTGKVGFWPNLLHNVAAYTVQYVLIVVAFLLCAIFILHNHFFLSRIFQRRIHQWKDADARITIDNTDPDRCFGFAPTYEAFNVQVSTLFFGGLIVLTSRWANSSPAFHKAVVDVNPVSILQGDVASLAALGEAYANSRLFHDFGQYAIAIGWLVFVGVVSMPALVKFLPLIPKLLLGMLGLGRVARVLPYRTEYLREYFPLTIWQSFGNGDEDIATDVLRGRVKDGQIEQYGFKHQSFWPTGDRKAFGLFVFAFTVFTGLWFPLPLPFIALERPHWLFYAGLAIVGFAITCLLFLALKVSLWWVDREL